MKCRAKNFKCKQCGICCTCFVDAYQGEASASDVRRWKKEGRFDILEWVDEIFGVYDIWINPRTHEDVNRCPWLRKIRNENRYVCRIHDTKPEKCKNYPITKNHALLNNCKGFNDQ